MSLLPRFFDAKEKKNLNFGRMLPHLGDGIRGLARGAKAAAIEGVFQVNYFIFGAEFSFSKAGFELDLNGDVAVGTRSISNGLLNGQSNSTRGAGK